jgi:hypothetical protein
MTLCEGKTHLSEATITPCGGKTCLSGTTITPRGLKIACPKCFFPFSVIFGLVRSDHHVFQRENRLSEATIASGNPRRVCPKISSPSADLQTVTPIISITKIKVQTTVKLHSNAGCYMSRHFRIKSKRLDFRENCSGQISGLGDSPTPLRLKCCRLPYEKK